MIPGEKIENWWKRKQKMNKYLCGWVYFSSKCVWGKGFILWSKIVSCQAMQWTLYWFWDFFKKLLRLQVLNQTDVSNKSTRAILTKIL